MPCLACQLTILQVEPNSEWEVKQPFDTGEGVVINPIDFVEDHEEQLWREILDVGHCGVR